jgi:hypothetical protein
MVLPRRQFLWDATRLSFAVLLSPIACSRVRQPVGATTDHGLDIPRTRPGNWDPLRFNRARGVAGAIPRSYLPAIEGPDGDRRHLGKHLPYVVAIGAPLGMLPLMWGDPRKGFAQHPNAGPSAGNPTGHWYDWIRLRRATDDEAEERESRFSSWPHQGPDDNGAYLAAGEQGVTAEGGAATIYLAEVPKDARPRELLRVHAHCRTHGEYVDFVALPG